MTVPSVDLNAKIPNNVGLADDPKVRRALEQQVWRGDAGHHLRDEGMDRGDVGHHLRRLGERGQGGYEGSGEEGAHDLSGLRECYSVTQT